MSEELVAEVLAGNATYAESFDPHRLDVRPARQLAIVTCMDSRIAVFGVFGLALGDAHVIRNAGAIVTDDVERSLLLSQYALGTRTIMVAGHTKCGVLGHDEEATCQRIEDERGRRPTFPLGSITSPEDGVRQSLRRLRQSPYLLHVDDVHGFVYDVDTGRLTPVD